MMDLQRKPNGKWKLRWNEGGRKRARTFDRKGDAINFEASRIRRKQLGQAAIPDDQALREFVETYWRLHALPNLSQATRDLYGRVWALHILPRLGDYGVRELTPKRLTRFRAELERAGVGTATVVKAMTIVQSILSFAVSEELVEYNAAAAVTKPQYTRAREPHIFLPPEVEQIRTKLGLRDRTLVSVLAYSGPRPEEVVCRLAWDDVGEHTIRYVDTKRRRVRFTPLLEPLAEDLKEWFLASGRPNRETAGVPGPRHRPLEPGRLAQLAYADMARGTRAAAARPQESDAAARGVRARRDAAERPPLELRDAARLRGRAAHTDREGGRHERADDRAALRRRGRGLGRQAGPAVDQIRAARRAADPQRTLWPRDGQG
jgi:integrase